MHDPITKKFVLFHARQTNKPPTLSYYYVHMIENVNEDTQHVAHWTNCIIEQKNQLIEHYKETASFSVKNFLIFSGEMSFSLPSPDKLKNTTLSSALSFKSYPLI
mmetsp:Transcript_24317/g.30335  ORF Transcript_24317/g.30335 Transcript_24317/m.30335 type:complete len:105 (+) Transcript_24317:241-555(+)